MERELDAKSLLFEHNEQARLDFESQSWEQVSWAESEAARLTSLNKDLAGELASLRHELAQTSSMINDKVSHESNLVWKEYELWIELLSNDFDRLTSENHRIWRELDTMKNGQQARESQLNQEWSKMKEDMIWKDDEISWLKSKLVTQES